MKWKRPERFAQRPKLAIATTRARVPTYIASDPVGHKLRLTNRTSVEARLHQATVMSRDACPCADALFSTYAILAEPACPTKSRLPNRYLSAALAAAAALRVLVAESITRRFFNVIHILSHSVPIIGAQVSLVDVAGRKGLHFTKVLDTFEEVDDGSSPEGEQASREYWNKKAQWTVDTADTLFAVVKQELSQSVVTLCGATL